MNRLTHLSEKSEQRKSDLVLDFGYVDIDSIVYHIPESLYPEFLPEPILISSPFGEYQASFVIDEGNFAYIRRMSLRGGRYPAAQYDAYFRKAISKADNLKRVFLSKT